MDKVVHFEIPAANVARARRFYSTVFQWKLTPVPQMEYTMIRAAQSDKMGMSKEPGAINGGMMKRSSKARSPVIYMNVKDIDASLAKIKKNGGKLVTPKQHIPGIGFTAYVKDTEGNVIGVWQVARR